MAESLPSTLQHALGAPTPDALGAVREALEVRELGQGEALFSPGVPVAAAWFVLEGAVTTVDPATGAVVELGPGELIGPHRWALKGARAVSARAVGRTRVGRLGLAEVDSLADAHPCIAARLASETRQRMPGLPGRSSDKGPCVNHPRESAGWRLLSASPPQERENALQKNALEGVSVGGGRYWTKFELSHPTRMPGERSSLD